MKLITACLVLLLASVAAAAEAPPKNIAKFIANCRKATAQRLADVKVLLDEAKQSGDSVQAGLLAQELADLKRGKLVVAPLTMPFGPGDIGALDTSNTAKVVRWISESEVLASVRYSVASVSIESRGSSPPRARVVKKLSEVEVLMVGLEGIPVDAKSFNLPAVVEVMDTTDGRHSMSAFDLSKLKPYLPKKNWIVQPD